MIPGRFSIFFKYFTLLRPQVTKVYFKLDNQTKKIHCGEGSHTEQGVSWNIVFSLLC